MDIKTRPPAIASGTLETPISLPILPVMLLGGSAAKSAVATEPKLMATVSDAELLFTATSVPATSCVMVFAAISLVKVCELVTDGGTMVLNSIVQLEFAAKLGTTNETKSALTVVVVALHVPPNAKLPVLTSNGFGTLSVNLMFDHGLSVWL